MYYFEYLPIDVNTIIILNLDSETLRIFIEAFHNLKNLNYLYITFLKLPHEYKNIIKHFIKIEYEDYQLILDIIKLFKILNLKYNLLELIDLKKLDLHNKGLNEIPSEVFHLTNLEELYLNNNQIRELPTNINKLTNLKKLILSENQLEILPREIVNLKSTAFQINMHFVPR
jgi:internalin A